MGQILPPKKVRGDLELESLEDFCETFQNMAFCKLIRISKETNEPAEKKFNLVVFEETDDLIPRPVLIKVENDSLIPEIISELEKQDKHVVFNAVIYVDNSDARVLGFRQWETGVSAASIKTVFQSSHQLVEMLPEKFEFRAVLLIKNERVGNWSPVYTLTVG